MRRARKSRALRSSSWCAAALARLLSVVCDTSPGSCEVLLPRCFTLGWEAMMLCLSVHVMVPSSWTRKECASSSFASEAARLMPRRAFSFRFIMRVGTGRATLADGPSERRAIVPN